MQQQEKLQMPLNCLWFVTFTPRFGASSEKRLRRPSRTLAMSAPSTLALLTTTPVGVRHFVHWLSLAASSPCSPLPAVADFVSHESDAVRAWLSSSESHFVQLLAAVRAGNAAEVRALVTQGACQEQNQRVRA